MEATLRFLTFEDRARFEDLSCLHCLDLENLEILPLESQEKPILKNKFYDLRETLSEIEARAGPSKCKTLARGPSEQCFYDVIVFSQPCYDRGRAQIYSKAPTWELSTFANVRDEIR